MPSVLILEDERNLREIFSLILSGAGFLCREAEEPEHAVRLAREMRPDLLIADLLLKGASGQEAALTIRDDLPGLPVIFVSALYSETFVDERLRNAFLPKPFKLDELIAVALQLASLAEKQAESVFKGGALNG
ncbi:MAG: response regulator [Firmicutes bacterium]|nr:response regulator [Bacillota bacterium]